MFVLSDQAMTGTKAAVSVDPLSNFDAVALKRNWELGGIIKNKRYLCGTNRKKIELFNPYEMASVHIAALNG